MHPSLQTIFGHLAGGLLWLTADGRIKYVNARAKALGGFEVGQQLAESTLKRAVAVVAGGRHDRPIDMEYLPPGGERRLLHAQTTPALSAGEAFVFLDEAAPHGEPLALDNLMTVIRSDLGNPLERLVRALTRLRDGDASLAQTEEALDQAKGIVETLQRMVDLSTLWSSESLLATDRIEIWPLLKQAWTQLQSFAESKRLTVRLLDQSDAGAMPVTYGSEFWIRRVLLESLQAALRHATPGATLDIELRQMGPRVLIVFRNSGMWPASSGRGAVTLAQPSRGARAAGTAAAPALAAKDLIGLHLCERIIRLHGGLLREEDDDGLRNFLIDLPTGAPGREAHDATMDAAQAQRYAADLAALMARRRKAPAAG
ncbi:MAG: sensor histidine kinase [Rubrivivax sp.]